MSETGRWALPLLDAGQAQKEMTVNEALARLDLLTQTAVVAVGVDAPPATPAIGQAWVVGATPTGAWAGHAGAVAGWTAGGWRFVAAAAGMTVWSMADGCFATDVAGAWLVRRGPAIPAPAGGVTVDAEARAALGAVLAALRAQGLIAA